MINFFKKYFILIVLVLLIVILIILKFFYGNKDENNIYNAPILTPTQIPIVTTVPHEIDNPELEKNETTVLPYMGKKMEISGYQTPGVMEIFIEKEEDKTEAEIEFKEWQKQYPFFKIDSVVYTIHKLN